MSSTSTVLEREQLKPVNEQLLDPRWVTGFVDGEGCFHVGINKTQYSSGVQVLPEFTVVQHARDIQVLYRLKQFFGCGVVRVNNGDRMSFRVRGIQELTKIVIPFFNQYPLQTKKQNDFALFKEVVSLMRDRNHLSMKGIEQIKEIAGRMNRKANFPAKYV